MKNKLDRKRKEERRKGRKQKRSIEELDLGTMNEVNFQWLPPMRASSRKEYQRGGVRWRSGGTRGSNEEGKEELGEENWRLSGSRSSNGNSDVSWSVRRGERKEDQQE